MNEVRIQLRARRGRKEVAGSGPGHLVGRKYIKLLEAYLHDLRRHYAHPNRVLYYDDVVVVYLLAFFNPSLRSLRCIEDASQAPGLRGHLSVKAVCKSTLSDANELFDPAHLEGLIAHLRADLPDLGRHDPELEALLNQVQIVDGSFFRLATDVAWAFPQSNRSGKSNAQVRLNCQMCLKTGLPSGISISGLGDGGEGQAAMAMLAPGQLYLFDSGVMSFAYLKAIQACHSHFLCCLSQSVNFAPFLMGPSTLTEQDQAAGVISDVIGQLPGASKSHPPREVVREVKIQYTDRQGQPQTLRLLTDLLDMPAHRVAELYRYRWQIELFFRWLKVSANFEHLTSQSRNGVTLSFHIAVIACLLTSLHTRQGVSKYSQMMLGLVAAGQAELEDILPIMQHRERERQRERTRQAAKRAAKKAG